MTGKSDRREEMLALLWPAPLETIALIAEGIVRESKFSSLFTHRNRLAASRHPTSRRGPADAHITSESMLWVSLRSTDYGSRATAPPSPAPARSPRWDCL